LRSSTDDSVLGGRIGEALFCDNADTSPDSCGATPKCAFCGALNTILESRARNEPVSGECQLMLGGADKGETLELGITAAPLELENSCFTLVALQDIADRKRKEVLERLFVHDLKNGLQGIVGWSEMLVEDPTSDTEKTAARIASLTRRIAGEIESHRLLTAAESNKLAPNPSRTTPEETAERLRHVFAHHEAAYSKTLEIAEPLPEDDLWTDTAVLDRILANMVTNGFEATPEGGQVRLGCELKDSTFRFEVWNEGKIPDETAAHIFKRSFSTKAPSGRGLGTYSMKLLGERVLGGTVRFTTDDEDGTRFVLDLPQSTGGG
jgi:signal transduction histidine kinase